MIQRKMRLPIAEINRVCQRYRVRELAQFGSALRDDSNAKSDVDLLVEFDPEARVSFITLARMQRELSTPLNRQAVHSYFSVDWNIVWLTATEDAPALREKIARILDSEYPPPTY